MNLHIKNMVSLRCKIIVKEVLEKTGIQFSAVELGEVEVKEKIADWQYQLLKLNLSPYGLELIDNKKARLIEKIKHVIIELVHYSDEQLLINFSDHLSKKLQYDYTYLANIFSESEGITIEKFIISHKIERVKELLIYNELSLTQIAQKLHYSSVSHISSQFKKVTGFTPSLYKQQKQNHRNNLESICII